MQCKAMYCKMSKDIVLLNHLAIMNLTVYLFVVVVVVMVMCLQVLLIWMLWPTHSNGKLSKEWSTTLAKHLVSCWRWVFNRLFVRCFLVYFSIELFVILTRHDSQPVVYYSTQADVFNTSDELTGWLVDRVTDDDDDDDVIFLDAFAHKLLNAQRWNSTCKFSLV